MPRRGIAAASSRLALRLAGLQGRRLPVTRSPGKAFTPQPGEYAVTWHCCGGLPGRRLSGTHSLGKAFTPQPGEYAVTWYCCGFFPARAALSRATGPQIAVNP
ncbi:hypothetical protein FOT85_11435 [Klebsiella michiganensis]|nr:hypothetical protein [Klebsiella michiganensis]MBE0112415.1 hypothetical protein [Klebsiella michiganensis]